MKITLDNLILKIIDQIFFLVDLLPFSKDIKTILKYIVVIDIYYSYHFDSSDELEGEKASDLYFNDPEDPEFLSHKRTLGIQYEEQLWHYLNDFVTFSMKYFGQQNIQRYFFKNKYTIIEAPLSFNKVDSRKFDLLKRYNLQFIQDSDIDHYVQNIIGHDIPAFHNEIAFNQQLPRPFNYLVEFLKKVQQNRYAVEVLENELCKEAAVICHTFLGGSYPNPDAKTIDALFNNFFACHELEIPIPKRLELLEISYCQFQLYRPKSRRGPIIERFRSILYFQSAPPQQPNDKLSNFESMLIDSYEKHFDSIKVDFEKWMFDIVPSNTKILRVLKEWLLKVKNDPALMQEHLDQMATIETNYSDDLKYFQAWLDSSVTLSQWKMRKEPDMFEFLGQFPLSEDESHSFMMHLGHLYVEYFQNIYIDNYENRFKQISDPNDKISIAKRDADFIDMLLHGEIDGHKGKLFNPDITIEDWAKIALQLNNIIRGISFDDNYNIHHPDCNAQAQAVKMYKEYLAYYLSTTKPIIKKYKKTRNGLWEHIKPSKTIPLAYTLINNDVQYLLITKHRKALIKIGLIHENTALADMRLIFSNMTPSTPITCIKSITQLAYYVKCMHNDKKVIKNILPTIWKVTAEIFVDINGNKYNWEDFRGLKPPANANLIDEAVEILLIPAKKSTDS